MEAQIAILLLIVPGYIARKIYKHTNDVRDDLSTFEETLYCLMYSGIISIVSITLLNIIYIKSIDVLSLNISDIEAPFNNMGYILAYILIVFFTSLLLGLCIYRLNHWYTLLVNIIRGKNKTSVILNKSIFDVYFNDGNYNHFIAIYKDDKLIGRGRLNKCVEKYKELGIEPCEEQFIILDEYYDGNIPYKQIYYDGRTGIAIKEYDINLDIDKRLEPTSSSLVED